MPKNFGFVALFSFSIFLLAESFADAAESGWGIWANNEKTHVYAFLPNNELKVWGQRYDYTIKDYKPLSREGVWRYEEGACWIGDNKQQLGNALADYR